MASYHNGQTSPGYHSPRSPSWQDPRGVDMGWQSPISYDHQNAPMPGWQSPPVPIYQSPTGSGQHISTSPGHHSPPPVGYQNHHAPGHQSPPPGGYQQPHPSGYHNSQQPVYQVPTLASHPAPTPPVYQTPAPVPHRHSTAPGFQIWTQPDLPVQPAAGQQSPNRTGQQSPPAAGQQPANIARHQSLPPAGQQPPSLAGHQHPPVIELPEHQSPPGTAVPPEPTPQRRGFSLSSVLPRRPSDQSAPPQQQQPPQFRRDTVSDTSVQTKSTPASTTTTKANAPANTPYAVGKSSAWYHGANYSLDEMWTGVMSEDPSLLTKCLKAGLNVNYCRWNKDEKYTTWFKAQDIGYGARTLADAAASRGNENAMRLLMSYGVDLTGGPGASFIATFGRQMNATYSLEQRKVVALDPWTTPLHRAARFGRVDMIRLLLGEGCVDPNVHDARKRTALHKCVLGKQPECAKLLLDRGAAIELGDINDMTPLAAAAFSGQVELVELFVSRGAVLDADDKDGETAVYLAAQANHFEVVKALVKHGAEINARNNNGWSAFFKAASTLNVNTMRILADYSADVDVRDNNGCTALLRATMARNVLLINHLLHLGADIDVGDNDGWTPLFAAMIHNDESLIALLLANGADISKADVYGNNALHHAALLGSTPVIRHVLGTQVHHKHSHSQANVLGETPAILAAKHNHHAVLKVLLKYGADPQYVDANGFRALDRAMYWGSHACIRLLSAHGVAIDSQAFVALQQGKADNPGAGLHEVVMQRLQPQQPQHSVSRKPTNPSSSQLRDLFARTVTPESLVRRMREKQGKPAEEPKPVKVEAKPNKPATVATPNKPATDPKLATAAKVEEEEEEVVSPDPFEACIPKLPASMIINNHTLSLKGGGVANTVQAGGAVASVALGIANIALGI